MLNFSSLTQGDLDAIISRLWQRGEEEAILYGLKSKEEMSRYLLGRAKQHGYTLKIGDDPVAAFGAAASDGGDTYYTWFIATERFTEEGRAITRFLRGFIWSQLQAHPGAKLELVSATGHPDADRWFNALGFVRQQPTNGVFSRYIYAKAQKG